MKKYRGVLMILTVALLFGASLGYFYWKDVSEAEQDASRLVVVLYEGGSERWVSLNMGVHQASEELGIETPITILAEKADPAGQQEIIEREIQSGCGGVLVAPASEEMAEYLRQVHAKLPVVIVEALGESDLIAVGGNDDAMARALAGSVAAKERSVVVLKQDVRRESVRLRYEAFLDEAQRLGIEVEEWEVGEGTADIARRLGAEIPRAVVAFDVQTLENAIDAAIGIDAYPRMYGIGSNEKIVYYLDRGLVKEICVENEFNMGYMAVMELAAKMKIGTPKRHGNVDYFLVNRDNLYSPEIERVLFPIVQ